MTTARLTFAAALLLVYGCAEETPPYSVEDFLADRILLQATMVRCGQDQSAGRHDPNCLVAREAVDRIAAAEAKAKREALEAESDRKREALRRARDAADERQRLAEEAERQRRQAEEFGTFEGLPEDADSLADRPSEEMPPGNGTEDAGEASVEEPSATPKAIAEPTVDPGSDQTESAPAKVLPEDIPPTT